MCGDELGEDHKRKSIPCIRASAAGPWASMSFSVFLSSVHCYAVVLNTPDPKP